MAEFDPDAFLKGSPPAVPAVPAAPAFDPDAFLSKEREKELRAGYLKDLIAPSEHLKANETPGTLSSALHNFTDYSQRLKDSATRGLMRPLGGLMHGVSGVFDPTSTFGERYRAGVGAEEDFANRAVANTPGALGVATDIIGGAGSTGVGTGAIKGGREALGKIIAQGATEGAVEGAARNAKDVGSAIEGGIIGGGVGAGTSLAVGGAAKAIPLMAGKVKGAQQELREVNQGVPPQTLLDNAKVGYKQLDNAGIAYAQPQTATLKQGLDDLATTNQYNRVAHSKISDYVDQLDKLAQNPAGAKFGELHNIRSALAKEARGPDASTREAAGKVVGEIDKLVTGNAPAINPNNVDIKNVYPQATRLWKAGTIAQDVEYVAGKAKRKEASRAGTNPDEANRGAFRPLQEAAENPKKFSPFSGTDERALLARIVQGDKVQNAYRTAGAAVPAARMLAGAAAAGLGLTHGMGPLAGGLGAGAAGGGAAQRMFERLAAGRGEQNIDALLRQITTGSSASTNNLPSRQALAILQAKQAAQRGGAAYAASNLGE